MVAGHFDASRRGQRSARKQKTKDGSDESARSPAIICAMCRVCDPACDQTESGARCSPRQHPAIRIGQVEVASCCDRVNAGAANCVLQTYLRVTAIEDVEIQCVVADIVNFAPQIFTAPQPDLDRGTTFQFSDVRPVASISRGKIGNEKQQNDDQCGEYSARFEAPELAR